MRTYRSFDEPPAWKTWGLVMVVGGGCVALAYACDRACFGPPAAAAPPVILDVVRSQLPATDRSADVCAEPVVEHAPPTRLGVILYEPVTRTERELVVRAIDGCRQTNRDVADPWLALALARIEADAGAPPGMLLAAWCREASMMTRGRSQRRIAGDIADGMATSFGPFQMQGWWLRWCGWSSDRRDDLLDAGTCYLARVHSLLPSAESECGSGAAWRVAEALAANHPKYAPRGCAAESQHWEILESWELTP